MNLAMRDIARHKLRFMGTAIGLGMLFTVVIAMQGIFAGMSEDAALLVRTMDAELWVVQRDTAGPFAEPSRLDPSLVTRAAGVPGVRMARAYTYATLQRDHHGRTLRMAAVGLSWPDERGTQLGLVAGRGLEQARGELIADASLGLGIGEVLRLGQEDYRVVGLTRDALNASGDAVVFVSVSDWQLIANDQPAEASQLERERASARLLETELGRAQPGLEALLRDTRWRPPAIAAAPLSAVLVNVSSPAMLAPVKETMSRWGDVAVYTREEQLELLLGGVIQRARMQIGLFTVVLSLTAAAIVMMVLYNIALEKTHDIAILKLMGASKARLAGLVIQQSWLLGALAYGMARAAGSVAYPYFPRRVVLTPTLDMAAPALIFLLTTLASLLGVWHVLRVDAGRVLEG
jgi:putative ABC transport system permease protein